MAVIRALHVSGHVASDQMKENCSYPLRWKDLKPANARSFCDHFRNFCDHPPPKRGHVAGDMQTNGDNDNFVLTP